MILNYLAEMLRICGTNEPENLVGMTRITVVNLLLRKMMGQDSNGMRIPAIHTENKEETLHLIMVDDAIPAGAKLCGRGFSGYFAKRPRFSIRLKARSHLI